MLHRGLEMCLHPKELLFPFEKTEIGTEIRIALSREDSSYSIEGSIQSNLFILVVLIPMVNHSTRWRLIYNSYLGKKSVGEIAPIT